MLYDMGSRTTSTTDRFQISHVFPASAKKVTLVAGHRRTLLPPRFVQFNVSKKNTAGIQYEQVCASTAVLRFT